MVRRVTVDLPRLSTSPEEVNILKEETNTVAHFLSPSELEVVYKTNIVNGLTSAEAEAILERDGPNELRQLQGNPYWKIFRHNFFGWFQCVLWAGALLNFIAFFASPPGDGDGHSRNEYLYLGIVIVATVLGTGIFGFYQEAKNAAVMSGFDNLIPPLAVVIRDGIKQEIPNNLVVVGDLVEIQGGQTVPADARVIQCTNLKTDMSSLTGESVAISHVPHNTHKNPLESKNMVYFSCPVTEGWGKAVVVDTGELTQIGKIAGLVTGLEKVQTPLNKEITHFVKTVCFIAFIFGLIFFIMVYYLQKNFLTALMYMLGIILANVPEGLLVTLTVSMTLSAGELKRKNCLAKSLQAVETLGSTSVICSDKTGTLTQNRMTVSHLFTDFAIAPHDDHTKVTDPVYTNLCFAASLNLKATFAQETIHQPIIKRKVFGDASEAAILRYMEENRAASDVQLRNPKVAEIPFSSVYKYQITIHAIEDSDYYYLTMKGAPEIVLRCCSTIYTKRESNKLTPQVLQECKEKFLKMANMGERIIGYADYKLPAEKFPKGFVFDTQNINFPTTDLRFIGAISMIDPPREEVPDSIATCRTAGIKVIMVTGDHPVTALAISRKIGTITRPTAYDYAFDHHIDVVDVPAHVKKQFVSAVYTGEDLRRMSAHDLRTAIMHYQEMTFARTTPQQKLFIVENYQALKYVVAVTGDGVNDSPALKKADIGIAMGITGTEVSKQAADMILLDDNFASIVLGIKEGRRIFDNLKKTIAYTLTSNTPEMFPFVLYAVLGIPLPISLILILVINVGTDLLPAISLAYESSELDIMLLPPRKLSDHLVNKALLYIAYFQIGMMQLFGSLFAYFFVFAEEGFFPETLMFVRSEWESKFGLVLDSYGNEWNFSERKIVEKKAQTAYFVAVCWTQIADVIICKTRRVSLVHKGMCNTMLNISIFVDLVAAIVVTYLPLCNTVLGTRPLQWAEFFISFPYVLLIIISDEFRRFAVRYNISRFIEEEIYY